MVRLRHGFASGALRLVRSASQPTRKGTSLGDRQRFPASVEVRYLPAELPLAWHGSFRDESIEAGVDPLDPCAAGGRFPGVEQSGLHSLRAPAKSGLARR